MTILMTIMIVIIAGDENIAVTNSVMIYSIIMEGALTRTFRHCIVTERIMVT